MLVKNDVAFSIVNYYPNIPKEHEIEIYPVSGEDYENFGKRQYKFDPISKKLIPKNREEFIDLSWSELRSKRNNLLSNTDWIAVSDNNLSEEQKEKWKIYRQQLRDFPSIISDPTNPDIDWPIPPYNL
jgi:hypothetical protein